jgi:thiol-disulfide isomerase/thioredoxin
MNTIRWSAVTGGLLVLIVMAMLFASPTSTRSFYDASTPTNAPPTGTEVTPIGTEFVRLPTATATVDIPEPLLTLTAFNSMFVATYASRPSATPGPSAITLTGKPHFVDFYATWCSPCWLMKPFVADMEEKYGDRVTFWEIDVDNMASGPLNREYQVVGIPLVVLLDAEGKTVQRLEGYRPEAELDAAIGALLGQSK